MRKTLTVANHGMLIAQVSKCTGIGWWRANEEATIEQDTCIGIHRSWVTLTATHHHDHDSWVGAKTPSRGQPCLTHIRCHLRRKMTERRPTPGNRCRLLTGQMSHLS